MPATGGEQQSTTPRWEALADSAFFSNMKTQSLISSSWQFKWQTIAGMLAAFAATPPRGEKALAFVNICKCQWQRGWKKHHYHFTSDISVHECGISEQNCSPSVAGEASLAKEGFWRNASLKSTSQVLKSSLCH